MIYKSSEIINELKKRSRLRKKCRESFWDFLQFMVPEFFTDYKYDKYMKKLSGRCEALVRKQDLIRFVRAVVNLTYKDQNTIGKMSLYGGVGSKCFLIHLFLWLIILDARRNIIYPKLRSICDYDEGKIFRKPKDNSVKTFTDACNYICDNAILKLTISLPPGAGKTLISSLLSAWVIGQNPINGSVMRNSYSADMAESMSFGVRAFIESDKFRYIFPEVELSKKRKSVKGWSVEGSTELTYFGSGPGGSVSGKRAKTLAMYDDFCKNMEEALSEAEIKSTWSFYTSVHIQRTTSGTAELIIGTRYVKNDLIGSVLEKEGEKWEVIKFKGLIEVENENGEIEERSFCEEIKTTEEYKSMRRVTDKFIFDSVIQQKPIGDEGMMFPLSSLKTFSMHELHDINYYVGFCDTADEGSDFLAAIILAGAKPRYRDFEWEELKKEYECINDWTEDMYSIDEYGSVFVDIKNIKPSVYLVPSNLYEKLYVDFMVPMNYYLVDVVFLQDGVGITTPKVCSLIERYNPNEFTFESNKDGKAYARSVSDLIRNRANTIIKTEFQSGNKYTRMLNESSRIKNYIYFRDDYELGSEYAKFMEILGQIPKLSKAKYDDPGDVLALASKFIFNLGSFIDAIDISKKDTFKIRIDNKPCSMDENKYGVFLKIKEKKKIKVLRTIYEEEIRKYMIDLIDVFQKDKPSLIFLKEEIQRLDLKFFGFSKLDEQ
jgi:hypothetical protein